MSLADELLADLEEAAEEDEQEEFQEILRQKVKAEQEIKQEDDDDVPMLDIKGNQLIFTYFLNESFYTRFFCLLPLKKKNIIVS